MWICPIGDQSPSPLPACALHTRTSSSRALQGCALKVLVEEVTLPLSAPGLLPMAAIGPGLLLAATGGHYMIYTAFLSCDMFSLLTFCRGRHARERMLRKDPCCFLLLYIQMLIPRELGS